MPLSSKPLSLKSQRYVNVRYFVGSIMESPWFYYQTVKMQCLSCLLELVWFDGMVDSWIWNSGHRMAPSGVSGCSVVSSSVSRSGEAIHPHPRILQFFCIVWSLSTKNYFGCWCRVSEGILIKVSRFFWIFILNRTFCEAMRALSRIDLILSFIT